MGKIYGKPNGNAVLIRFQLILWPIIVYLKANGYTMKFDGFMKLYHEVKEDEEESNSLPKILKMKSLS